MSCDADDPIADARCFLDELFSKGIPLHQLLNQGTFPDGWAARYLAFVDRAKASYGDGEPMPREVSAVIYSASVYCTKRYFDWQRSTGGVNDSTEATANEVRWAGDRLVLGRFWRDAAK